MILDLDAQTVFIPTGTTLTRVQLLALVDILDTDIVFEDDEEDPEAGRHSIDICFMWQLTSDVSTKTYCVLKYDKSEWACSCPDWIYRKSVRGEICKHIERLTLLYGRW